MVSQACQRAQLSAVRLSGVLQWLGVARSTWYRHRAVAPKRPGRKPKPVPEVLASTIRHFAECYPWWGYKRIAVIARRAGVGVTNKQVYRVMKAAGLLQKRRVHEAEVYQTVRLFELLPQGPNDL